MAGIEADAVPLAAYAQALSGALFSLLEWWISQGMGVDPEEMDELFGRMAWQGLAAR